MIKGIQRSMIVLKNTGSPIFEEAYFILREGSGRKADRGDMVSEASRIIAANRIPPEPLFNGRARRRRERLLRLILFLAGLLIGGAAALIFL